MSVVWGGGGDGGTIESGILPEFYKNTNFTGTFQYDSV